MDNGTMKEKARARLQCDATVVRGASLAEAARARGRYAVECYGPDGKLKWRDEIDNTVCHEGMDVMLDAALAGSAYTVTGPFVGLISSVSWSAIADTDTMASHAGWTEAGATNAPTYTSPRKTAAWNAASGGSKAMSSAAQFAITGTGTIKGMFMCYGSGAVSTIDSTAGKLWSAGLFSQGDKSVGNGDTVNVTYSTSL